MPQKIYNLSGVGEVLVVKRKGAKNMRLSIDQRQRVRVSLPVYMPYALGLDFARKRQDWIIKHLGTRSVKPLINGSRIGKSHRLVIIESNDGKTSTRLVGQEVRITVQPDSGTSALNDTIEQACERALRIEAQNLLTERLRQLAIEHNYSYKEVKIRKLKARWGSCNNSGVITLSIYLVQLPWAMIDYVLLHELAHTRHMHHQQAFWNELKSRLPHVAELRKQIRAYSPTLLPDC